MSRLIAQGVSVAGGERTATGRLVSILDVQDLVRLIDDGDDDLIVCLTAPNVTMMAPLFDRVAGLVCTYGDAQSHVAIVARELGVPCLVRAEFSVPLGNLGTENAELSSIAGELTIVTTRASDEVPKLGD